MKMFKINKKSKEKKEEEPVIVEQPKKEMGINEKIDKITDYLEEGVKKEKGKDKKKDLKLPNGVKRAAKNWYKKNKVMIMLLKNNRTIVPLVSEIRKGMIYVNGNWHSIPPTAIWMYKGKIPTIILPEWDILPIEAEYLYNEALEGKRIIDPQSYMIRAIKMQEAMAPNKFGGRTIIWVMIGAAGLIYVLFGGQ